MSDGPADERRELLERFAGGVAHDISNPLQAILGFAEFMRSQKKDDPELLDCLEEIITACKRAGAMVQEMIAISRQRELACEPLDLNDAVSNAAEGLRAVVGEPVRLELALGAGLPKVALDPAAFERLLRALCSQAKEMMPEGGVLTLRTDADGAHAASHVRLSLQDTGAGFDPALVRRLFEPFYAKKQIGRGKGLDLAVAEALIGQHGGFIAVETAPGRGTTFHLYFPKQQATGSG